MKNALEQPEEKKHSLKPPNHTVKFEVYGDVMLDKQVGYSGNSGRVYLPGDWVGHRVKIIRTG